MIAAPPPCGRLASGCFVLQEKAVGVTLRLKTMVTRKSNEPQVIPPSVSPKTGIELLNRLIAQAEELLASQPFSSNDHQIWKTNAKDYLLKAFGSDSPYIGLVLNAGGGIGFRGQSEEFYARKRAETLGDQIDAVKAAIDSLKLELELNPRCISCGQKNPEDHIYCSNCGKPLRPPEDTPTVSF